MPAMDVTLGEQYDSLRKEIREFLGAHKEQRISTELGAVSGPEGRKKLAAWQRLLVDHGYVGRTVPKEFGGFGAEPDVLEALVIEEEFRTAGISLGMQNQGIGMFVPTLMHYGTDEQKRRYIGPTLRGEMIWCQGYSEPGSGSDLASLKTKGVLDGDFYVVNGQKIWTSTAKSADMMFALVRTEANAGKHAGITYMVLSMETPGLDVRPLKQMDGNQEFNEVFFTDVRVPRENVIAQPGQGWEVGTYTLRHERAMLGRPHQSERFYNNLVEVLRETGLITDPIFRDRLMELQGRLLAMKYHGLRLLTDTLKKRESGVGRLVVKLNGCQLNYDLCGLAIEALGTRGLLTRGSKHVRDHGAWQEQYMYALGLIIGGGTAQIQKNIISEVGLGMPREPKAKVPARGA